MSDKSFITEPCDSATSCGISTGFPVLSPSQRQVTHALLTRPPLTSAAPFPRRGNSLQGPFDLHVLGTPPAFVLSQDQTLENVLKYTSFCYVTLRAQKWSRSSQQPHFVRFQVKPLEKLTRFGVAPLSQNVRFIGTFREPCSHFFPSRALHNSYLSKIYAYRNFSIPKTQTYPNESLSAPRYSSMFVSSFEY